MNSMTLLVFNVYPTTQKLFNDKLTTTGIIVLAVFLGGFLIWSGSAFIRYLRMKRLEQLPGVLGDPQELFEQTASLAMLGVSERHVLKKVAWKMKLPQPVSLLLSPNLLRQAAEIWKESHALSPTRQWGLHHLNQIALKIYNQNLDQLRTNNSKPITAVEN
jgi:hypothetical protein